MKLRWKKEPAETGLRRIGAGPRGSYLHDGTNRYASVCALWNIRTGIKEWYWVAGWQSGVPHKNTCKEPCKTEDEAKAQAMDYVKENLAMKGQK